MLAWGTNLECCLSGGGCLALPSLVPSHKACTFPAAAPALAVERVEQQQQHTGPWAEVAHGAGAVAKGSLLQGKMSPFFALVFKWPLNTRWKQKKEVTSPPTAAKLWPLLLCHALPPPRKQNQLQYLRL